MVSTVLRFGLPAAALLFFVLALVSALQAVLARTSLNRQAYGVGQQEVRKRVQVSAVRGLVLVVSAAILFGVAQLLPEPDPLVFAPLPTPAATRPPLALPSPASTATPSPTPTTPPQPVQAAASPSPTNPVLAATATATPSPTATTISAPTTAVVNSPVVGLYLRNAPAGSQALELLFDGTVLTLLPGRVTEGDFEWQEVQAPSGATGWVAVDFIVYGTVTLTPTSTAGASAATQTQTP